MTTPTIRGLLMVLAAAMLWGTTGTAQSLVPAQLSSFWVGALRLAVAALFFLPMLGWGGTRGLTLLPWRQVLLAAVCMCAYNISFFAGVRASGVAIGTAVALGSGPIWAGLLQALSGGGRPTAAWWLGTAVAVAGVTLMIAGPGDAATPSAAGLALCLLAGLCYAGYALVNKHMVTDAPAGAITAAVFVTAAAIALPAAWALAGVPTLRGSDFAVMLWLGVMGTGVAYLLFSHALRHVAGATAVALALAEPVTAFVLAIVVVGERPGIVAFVGLLTVVAGLTGVVRAEIRAGSQARADRLHG